MTDDNNTSGVVGCLGIVIIAIVLAVISPGKERLDQRLSSDGWIPVDIRRINLIVCSLNYVEGVTGAKGFYFGCLGHYYGGETGPEY